MNQILDYNPIRNGDGDSNYQGRNSGNKGNVIKVFAIILIVFAICLIAIGIFNKIRNDSQSNNQVNETDADIKIVQEGSSLKISIEHDKIITKMIYNWNTSSEKTIKVDTGKTFETTIEIPVGENTLNIQVIDEQNHKTFFAQTITSEEGIDIINPVINYEQTENKKIKITVTDETALDFITYRWNDEDETVIKADEDYPKKIEIEIDIKEGNNNLTISAVDKNNNTESAQQGFTGLKQPNISVTLTENKDKLKITCTHENGISKIEYTLNDKPYAATLEETPQDVTFEQALDEGNNVIILTVTSVDGTVSNFAGQCTYKPNTAGVTVE